MRHLSTDEKIALSSYSVPFVFRTLLALFIDPLAVNLVWLLIVFVCLIPVISYVRGHGLARDRIVRLSYLWIAILGLVALCLHEVDRQGWFWTIWVSVLLCWIAPIYFLKRLRRT
jgi:multisubunit Na+/H+ antiporter MnhF subunit